MSRRRLSAVTAGAVIGLGATAVGLLSPLHAASVTANEREARASIGVRAELRWSGRYGTDLGYGVMCFEARNNTGRNVVVGHRLYVEGLGIRHAVPKRWTLLYCTDGTEMAYRGHRLTSAYGSVGAR